MFKESALLGDVQGGLKFYLNTHEPFSMITVGVQGSGKSHTLACVLESCILVPDEPNQIQLRQPLSTVVFHYDTNVASICEATGLIATSNPTLEILKKYSISPDKYHLGREQMIVLVSPSYYLQRKKFYGDYCIVKPLLFQWKILTADHLKRLMGIASSDSQLYVAVLLDILRKYQRLGRLPEFSAFVEEVKKTCNVKQQEGPLGQRLALLESIIAESDRNRSIVNDSADLLIVKPGRLIVVDLTDPLLSKEDVNSIFQVLTEQYRAIPSNISGGKVLALDEAHKFMNGTSSDELSAAIVNCARLMRHDDMRLIISTQSPLSLAPELIELCSLAILHRFYSSDWFEYLSRKLPLSPEQRNAIINLDPGVALMFAPRNRLFDDDVNTKKDGNFFTVSIRSRLTSDHGVSKRNALIT